MTTYCLNRRTMNQGLVCAALLPRSLSGLAQSSTPTTSAAQRRWYAAAQAGVARMIFGQALIDVGRPAP
jgi:hypothetical protein